MIRRNRGEKKREEDKEIEVNIDRAARDRDLSPMQTRFYESGAKRATPS